MPRWSNPLEKYDKELVVTLRKHYYGHGDFSHVASRVSERLGYQVGENDVLIILTALKNGWGRIKH